jgi:hypothetical protein
LVRERRLTFWIGSSHVPLVSGDGRELAASEVQALAGGTRFVVTVPADVKSLSLRESERQLTLAIEAESSSPLLERAAQLRKEGDLDGARALWLQLTADLSPTIRDRAMAALARASLEEGDFRAASEALRDSRARVRASGCLSAIGRDATALAYVLTRGLHDYAEAREVLHVAAGNADSVTPGQQPLRERAAQGRPHPRCRPDRARGPTPRVRR